MAFPESAKAFLLICVKSSHKLGDLASGGAAANDMEELRPRGKLSAEATTLTPYNANSNAAGPSPNICRDMFVGTGLAKRRSLSSPTNSALGLLCLQYQRFRAVAGICLDPPTTPSSEAGSQITTRSAVY
jgi:hypothetical protein